MLVHNQKQRSGVQKKSTVTDYYVYCAYCVSLGLGSFFIFHSFSLPISEITQNSCLHGNLILQFSRRITFFLQHMGAKRIEIDVEVKAIFPPPPKKFSGIWRRFKCTSSEILEQQSPCMDTGPETKLVSKRVTQN